VPASTHQCKDIISRLLLQSHQIPGSRMLLEIGW